MKAQSEIAPKLDGLTDHAPSGFALAMHINFTSPRFLFQTYSAEWISQYSEQGMVMFDPTVRWGFENEGTRRWSEMADDDPKGVLTAAAKHGLNYGLTCAMDTKGSRSIGSFARPDREFTQDEVAIFTAAMRDLHALTLDLQSLTPTTARNLAAKNILFLQSDA